ncbi:hypothetical protein IWX65_003472 [Arthrobacter sp. CAN_A214]|uniref:hypothetical protein n=1 Tax=Arthrobacter sp. CAN_A214 TaxID=2787720 RepID=UPI0018C9E2DE
MEKLTGRPKGIPITGSAGHRVHITARVVIWVVLSLSLFIAFTTSAVAVLCLQMDHHGSVVRTTRAVDAESLGESIAAGPMSMASGPEGAVSAQACCHQQVSTPKAVIGVQKVSPPEEETVLRR